MNKHTAKITSVAIALLLLAAQAMPALAAGPAKASPQAKWTLMVYMNGDNNLEKYVTSDIETELAQPGSNADVNVVALADRIPGYSKSAGDWTSTKLFYIKRGMQATPDNAVADWGERNMADPQTLVDFIRWSQSTYPAERYALIFWDHAWGWRPGQTIWDETSGAALDPDEIITAMQAAGPVDVIGYDACEGQMIEVQATWKKYAQAMAGSQEDVGYHGIEYDEVLAALQARPGMTAAELAVEIARTMRDWTGSAVILDARWDDLLRAVDEWAAALFDGLPAYRAAYDAAYLATQGVADPTNKDLYDAAAQIQARVADPAIRAKSQAVMDAVDAVMLYEWHYHKYKGAHGIGIFWPRLTADLDEPSSPENDFSYYRDKLVFSKLTRWDEFISAYVSR